MDMLSAETRIEGDAIVPAMEKLRAEHSEYEVDTGFERQWEFRTHYGSVHVALAERSALIRVVAVDETNLSYMKMSVAEHVGEYVGSTVGIRWQGDGVDAGLPVFFREMRVMSSTRIAPHMQRLRFAGSDLARFAHGGLHVRLLFPPRGRTPVWPVIGADGMIVWPSGEDALLVRVYTIRAIDVAAGWVDIDFVLHAGEDISASSFAEAARIGDIVGMIGPGGGEVPDAGNLLLAGDETAIPAIARILEELPAETSADVYLEVDGPADRLVLAQRDAIRVRWLYRNGREAGTAGLLSAALREKDAARLPGDLYVWAGCEFADFRELRALVRKEWGLKKDRHLVVAYWRRGLAGESEED